MPPVEDKHTFSSCERLKSSQSIRDVLDANSSVWCFPIKCFYSCSYNQTKPHQLAVVVPKKRFHHAVDRNRIKRLMRESYRLQKNILNQVDLPQIKMCWIYQGKDLPDYGTVFDAATTILKKIAEQTKNDL